MEDPNPASQFVPSSTAEQSKPAKAPVVRGARACTVCRAAKMKCVGAEDDKPCQRCKRSGLDCVFEKHRRGRKPGSKLSEASKMLRRLEKGLNTAKAKSQTHHPRDRFTNNDLPPLNLPPDNEGRYRSSSLAASSHSARDVDEEEDGDDSDKTGEGIHPAQLISKEHQRNSFFKTILNPENHDPKSCRRSNAGSTRSSPPPPRSPSAPASSNVASNTNGLSDPVAAGIITEDEASNFFDMFFIRCNPFINLFDPVLHTFQYVRSRCPFLFTTIMMACCKFFKLELYPTVQTLAHEFAVRAFAENEKSVEVVQAFACLTYWKEPDDKRIDTWTYIGYACRMAVELGLNRYVGKGRPDETDLQMRDRRNRERTYLVLFVHDRSLSTQTGRQWMLPEDDLVKNSDVWHEAGGSQVRPEDVIISAFVQLRRIVTETTEEYYRQKANMAAGTSDMNLDPVLGNANDKLEQWIETWQQQMRKASGEHFHLAFLKFFWLYVRLFINSFGISSPYMPASQQSAENAITLCYNSASENLEIVSKEFAPMEVLRYGQDSVTIMNAYCALFLLRLLRDRFTLLHEGAKDDIYMAIRNTAQAYDSAPGNSSVSSAAHHHARFLRSLITSDMIRAKQMEQERYQQSRAVEVHTQGSYTTPGQPSQLHPSYQMYPPQPITVPASDHPNFLFASAPTALTHFVSLPTPMNTASISGYTSTSDPGPRNGYTYPTHSSSPSHSPHNMTPPAESDIRYGQNMFREIGITDGFESMIGNINPFVGFPLPDSSGIPNNSGMAFQDGHINTTGNGYSNHTFQQQQYPMNIYPAPGFGGLGRR